MALLASLRETRLYVIGIRGALKVLQMAAHASRVRAGQVVVIVQVTLHALHGSMRASQGKASGRVVEVRSRPRRCIVTLLARLRESRLHVIGIRGALEVLQMAAHASRVRAGQVVVVVHVALHALRCCMSARQGETCGRVVERRSLPRGCSMTLLASLRESRLYVIGIGGALEVLQMARHASRVGAGQVVVVVHVTLRALRRCMSARQGETGGRVVEARSIPGSRIVALLAR